MKAEIEERFQRNLNRVRNLVAIYRTHLSGSGRGRRTHEKTDVLRAAAVLLHASMEDVLRSLARWKLPTAHVDVLENVPLVGGTATRFGLGALSAHRGKTVDQVISASTDWSLERSNYNNPGEVNRLLTNVGINTAPLAGYMATLDQAMKRRHQIVHRADETDQRNPGRGNHRVVAISPATVEAWTNNTEQFVQAVLAQV